MATLDELTSEEVEEPGRKTVLGRLVGPLQGLTAQVRGLQATADGVTTAVMTLPQDISAAAAAALTQQAVAAPVRESPLGRVLGGLRGVQTTFWDLTDPQHPRNLVKTIASDHDPWLKAERRFRVLCRRLLEDGLHPNDPWETMGEYASVFSWGSGIGAARLPGWEALGWHLFGNEVAFFDILDKDGNPTGKRSGIIDCFEVFRLEAVKVARHPRRFGGFPEAVNILRQLSLEDWIQFRKNKGVRVVWAEMCRRRQPIDKHELHKKFEPWGLTEREIRDLNFDRAFDALKGYDKWVDSRRPLFRNKELTRAEVWKNWSHIWIHTGPPWARWVQILRGMGVPSDVNEPVSGERAYSVHGLPGPGEMGTRASKIWSTLRNIYLVEDPTAPFGWKSRDPHWGIEDKVSPDGVLGIDGEPVTTQVDVSGLLEAIKDAVRNWHLDEADNCTRRQWQGDIAAPSSVAPAGKLAGDILTAVRASGKDRFGAHRPLAEALALIAPLIAACRQKRFGEVKAEAARQTWTFTNTLREMEEALWQSLQPNTFGIAPSVWQTFFVGQPNDTDPALDYPGIYWMGCRAVESWLQDLAFSLSRSTVWTNLVAPQVFRHLGPQIWGQKIGEWLARGDLYDLERALDTILPGAFRDTSSLTRMLSGGAFLYPPVFMNLRRQAFLRVLLVLFGYLLKRIDAVKRIAKLLSSAFFKEDQLKAAIQQVLADTRAGIGTELFQLVDQLIPNWGQSQLLEDGEAACTAVENHFTREMVGVLSTMVKTFRDGGVLEALGIDMEEYLTALAAANFFAAALADPALSEERQGAYVDAAYVWMGYDDERLSREFPDILEELNNTLKAVKLVS